LNQLLKKLSSLGRQLTTVAAEVARIARPDVKTHQP
jgi:hypothetical protein